MTGAVVAPVKADLIHRLSTSTSLSVDGALTVGTRVGSTYAVSGSNVEVASGGAFGGLTAPTSVTAASAMTEGSYILLTHMAMASSVRGLLLTSHRMFNTVTQGNTLGKIIIWNHNII